MSDDEKDYISRYVAAYQHLNRLVGDRSDASDDDERDPDACQIESQTSPCADACDSSSDKGDGVSSPVASGGLCAPTGVQYDMPLYVRDPAISPGGYTVRSQHYQFGSKTSAQKPLPAAGPLKGWEIWNPEGAYYTGPGSFYPPLMLHQMDPVEILLLLEQRFDGDLRVDGGSLVWTPTYQLASGASDTDRRSIDEALSRAL